MTDIITYQNIDLFSWDTLYVNMKEHFVEDVHKTPFAGFKSGNYLMREIFAVLPKYVSDLM
jgi:hypothetical protein